MPRLVVNPGSPVAWEIQLKPGTNFIGRGFANDFKIADGSVSGSHCQITVKDQSVVIKDLGSTNGTFVNRSQIQETNLQDGSTVNLGAVVLSYYADGVSGPHLASPPLSAGSAQVHSEAVIPVPPPMRGQARVMVPAQPAADAVPPPAVTAVPMQTDGPQNCKSHPRASARFFCPGCRHYFCELCVNSRAVQGAQHKYCRHCGAECVPIQVPVNPAFVTKRRGFFARLPQAFMYPCRGGGILVLIVGTILLASLKFFAGTGGLSLATLIGVRNGLPWSWWGLIMQVFVLGYLFAYMQNVIHSTAAEETELPPLPSMTNFWEDILRPCLQFVGLMILCFGPAIGVGIWAGSTEDAWGGIAALVTLCLGAVYFPMSFLAAALLDSFLAANPLTVVPALMKAPFEYIVTLILLAGVFAMRWLGDEVLPALFPRGLSTHSMPKLVAFLGAEAFWSVVCLYLLTVGVHILGLLYVSKKERFGWLNR
jgi:hypothetical protein